MSGTLYFITGLSGAGKTTLGLRLYEELRRERSNVIRWDGDLMRDALCEPYDKKYDIESRKQGARRDARMMKMLTDQGVDVVSSTISLFEEIRTYYRENIQNYIEIFVDCPMDVLQSRDTKGIYEKALAGEIHDVVGVDIQAEYPRHPDIYILNDGIISTDDMYLTLIEELKRFE